MVYWNHRVIHFRALDERPLRLIPLAPSLNPALELASYFHLPEKLCTANITILKTIFEDTDIFLLARAVRRGFKWALKRVDCINRLNYSELVWVWDCIIVIITLEGIEKIKTEKKKKKTTTTTTNISEKYFFTDAVRICQQTLKWLPNFDWLLAS